MVPDSPANDRTAASDERELVAVVGEGERGPTECAIFPVDADEEELTTTWISAAEGSVVSLDEMV